MVSVGVGLEFVTGFADRGSIDLANAMSYQGDTRLQAGQAVAVTVLVSAYKTPSQRSTITAVGVFANNREAANPHHTVPVTIAIQ